jgi:hypothetical protein
MRPLLAAVLLVAPACGGDDDGAGVDGGGSADSAVGVTDGAVTDGAITDDDSGAGVDAGIVGTPDCNLAMDGASCTMDDSCNWMTMCSEGRCDCPFGTWACSAVDLCSTGPMCPNPRETSCGDSCDGAATGCLCACGGGGSDFTACECRGGRFECNIAC